MSSFRVNKILDHLKSNNKNNPLKCKPTRSIDEIDERFQKLVGQDLGTSAWIQLKQNNLDAFSDLTHDHNWIHKKDAAKNGSPFGDTIAHGLLTLSMLPKLVLEVTMKQFDGMSLKWIKSGVNYGFDKVRFLAPVFVDNKIRAKFVLKEAKRGKKYKSMRYVFDVIVETKNKNNGKISDALFAEWVGMTIYR